MSRKIIGVTVGTPQKPQKIIEQTKTDKEIERLSEDIADLKQNGAGGGVTTEQANSLWAIMQKTAFSEQLTDEELNAFKTAWGITEESGGDNGGEVEPDEPIEPDNPDTPETGSTLPYIALAVIALGAAGAYVATKNKAKMYRI